jgi:hypothetical protein
MEANRKAWNDQQQALRKALSRPETHTEAIALFMSQHARVHTAGMSGAGLWSFQDEVLDGLSETAVRAIPAGGEHSIAWMVWHSARIEDVTMSVLAAGGQELLGQGGWFEKMKVNARHTGNVMPGAEVSALSEAIDIPALLAYRAAVGRHTREIVNALTPAELKSKVDPARLQRLVTECTVLETASDLLVYWGGLTISGLLLMPPTRHNFVHLNEALRIKGKLKRL